MYPYRPRPSATAEAKPLLDPNPLSSDGTVALADWLVSRDGKLVTSRYPMDLPAFCREMLKVAQNEK